MIYGLRIVNGRFKSNFGTTVNIQLETKEIRGFDQRHVTTYSDLVREHQYASWFGHVDNYLSSCPTHNTTVDLTLPPEEHPNFFSKTPLRLDDCGHIGKVNIRRI